MRLVSPEDWRVLCHRIERPQLLACRVAPPVDQWGWGWWFCLCLCRLCLCLCHVAPPNDQQGWGWWYWEVCDDGDEGEDGDEKQEDNHLHLPEPQKGAVTGQREPVQLDLLQGGWEKRGWEGSPAKMGEVQHLGEGAAIMETIKGEVVVFNWCENTGIAFINCGKIFPHLKVWSCCKEINRKWLQTPATVFFDKMFSFSSFYMYAYV